MSKLRSQMPGTPISSDVPLNVSYKCYTKTFAFFCHLLTILEAILMTSERPCFAVKVSIHYGFSSVYESKALLMEPFESRNGGKLRNHHRFFFQEKFSIPK